MDIKTSVVAILNDKNKIMGTGFVAGENLILTCAHVVEQATAGLNERVIIRFSDNSKTEAIVEQSSFSPSYEKDVALLHVDSLPQGIAPLPLGNTAGSAGHDFYAYGYASVTDVQGIGARGKIVDIVDSGRLVQLTSQEPDHGMSGGPVLDEKRRVVIGMVTKGKGLLEKDQNLRNTQTTFATAADVFLEICPELNVIPFDSASSLEPLVEEAENVNVVAEVVGGDKVVTNVYNYYQPPTPEKKQDNNFKIGQVFQRLLKSWTTWVVLAFVLTAGGYWIWKLQQPIQVSECSAKATDFVVLVGKFEALNGAAVRDVGRSIVEDLKRKLIADPPPTNFVICEYPNVLKAADVPKAAALNHATVVIWGNYTPDFVEAEIQIGVLPDDVLLPQETLEETVNVSIRLSNEREDSVVRQVLTIADVILMSQGNIYGYMQGTIKLIGMPPSEVEIISAGIPANLHRFSTFYVLDTPKALEEVDAALKIRADNPLLHIFRAAALQRLGEFNLSIDSVNVAKSRGPKGWTTPYVFNANRDLFMNNPSGAIESFGQLINAQPSDWYPYTMRGYLYLTQGELKLAKADIDQALALNPQENWPYTWAVAIAFREGRLSDAKKYLNEAREKFPNVSAGENAATIIAAEKINPFTPGLSAFWSMSQGQFYNAIKYADASLLINPYFTDVYFVKGFSACNLKNYADAEAAYTKAIELEPKYYLLYLLRAEARLRQNNLPGAQEDAGAVMASQQPELLATAQMKVSCENILIQEP